MPVRWPPLSSPRLALPPLHRVHGRLRLPATPNPRFFFFHPEAPNRAATTDAQQRRDDTRGNLQVGQSPHKQAARVGGWEGGGGRSVERGGAGGVWGGKTKTAEGATEGLLCLAAAVLRVCRAALVTK